jgi:hypothetical protein
MAILRDCSPRAHLSYPAIEHQSCTWTEYDDPKFRLNGVKTICQFLAMTLTLHNPTEDAKCNQASSQTKVLFVSSLTRIRSDGPSLQGPKGLRSPSRRNVQLLPSLSAGAMFIRLYCFRLPRNGTKYSPRSVVRSQCAIVPPS